MEKTDIDKSSLPKHVAIIMDGNRRWAKEKNLSEFKGHNEGRKTLEKIMDFGFELGIKYITVYAFSGENLKKRSEEEKKHLFSLFAKGFVDLLNKEEVHKKSVNVNVFGRINLLPKEVKEAILKTVEKTKNYSNHFFNLCLVYDGKDEIVDSVKEIAKKVKNNEIDINEINRETIKKHLYTKDTPPPELIIRTGMKKEKRLSGFLLWDSSYSEFYFTEVLWPAFNEDELLKAIKNFQSRERRFGG